VAAKIDKVHSTGPTSEIPTNFNSVEEYQSKVMAPGIPRVQLPTTMEEEPVTPNRPLSIVPETALSLGSSYVVAPKRVSFASEKRLSSTNTGPQVVDEDSGSVRASVLVEAPSRGQSSIFEAPVPATEPLHITKVRSKEEVEVVKEEKEEETVPPTVAAPSLPVLESGRPLSLGFSI